MVDQVPQSFRDLVARGEIGAGGVTPVANGTPKGAAGAAGQASSNPFLQSTSAGSTSSTAPGSVVLGSDGKPFKVCALYTAAHAAIGRGQQIAGCYVVSVAPHSHCFLCVLSLASVSFIADPRRHVHDHGSKRRRDAGGKFACRRCFLKRGIRRG